MKLRNLLLICFGIGALGVFLSSCADNYTEEDLLKDQYDLAAKADSAKLNQNIAALNQAGELLSFRLQVVNTDGQGVEGLDVTMTAAADGGTAAKTTLTTDATGAVYFDKVAIGGNAVNISGGGIMDANLLINFGAIQQGTNYQIINGNIVPTPVTENATVTVIDNSAAMATVKGKATIETDLTNDTEEVPQDVTIKADLDESLVLKSSLDTYGQSIQYFIANNNNATNVGVAQIDNTTGQYSMQVPAGIDFHMIVPNIQAKQRIAVNSINGKMLDSPEYRDIETNFGPNYGTDGIPTVAGAMINFDSPANPGEGFTFGSFQKVGRPLFFGGIDGQIIASNATVPTDYENLFSQSLHATVQFTSLGSGYFESPAISISDPNGNGAYAEAYIRMAITGLTVSNGGTGYAANAFYSFNLRYDEKFYNTGTGSVDTNPDQTWSNFILTVQTDASGKFTQANVDAAVQNAMDNGDTWFDVNNLDKISDYATNIRLEANTSGGGDAVLDISSIVSHVSELRVKEAGDGYTNPSFSFSGGGASTQATLDVLKFGTQWSFDVDNSNVTTPYSLLPQSINFKYLDVTTSTPNYVQTSSNAQNVNTGSTPSLLNILTVDNSGNIQFVDQTASYMTSFYASEQPEVNVVKNTATQAAKFIRTSDINSQGQITGLSNNNNLGTYIYNAGSGYANVIKATIEPTITGAPGSSATVDITGGYFDASGEYNWGGGYTITNQGSGYLQNLNQTSSTISFYTPSTYNTLDAGDTYVFDIRYGTGNKTDNVQ